eukprot:SAG11_NODE_285_length_11230_cov_6.339412_10_plen_100_part_00
MISPPKPSPHATLPMHRQVEGREAREAAQAAMELAREAEIAVREQKEALRLGGAQSEEERIELSRRAARAEVQHAARLDAVDRQLREHAEARRRAVRRF